MRRCTTRGETPATSASRRTGIGKGNLPAQDEELRRLWAEVKRQTMERNVLKEATTFFAGESS